MSTAAWAEAERQRFPYELVSNWRVSGPMEDVYDALTDAAELPRWWPQAYNRVTEITHGDSSGNGRILDIVVKGALPYALRWRCEILEADKPRLIRLKASGELVGFGEWRLVDAGNDVAVTYTWRVRSEQPILRRLEFLLKPLFAANHHWVMRKGEEGLKRELIRRRAAAGPRSPG